MSDILTLDKLDEIGDPEEYLDRVVENLEKSGVIHFTGDMSKEMRYQVAYSMLELQEKMQRWHQEERTDNKRTFQKVVLQNRVKGNYRIENYHIDEHDSYALFHGIDTGDHVRLMCGSEVVMSDTKMERLTNQEFLNSAHGKVLIGGLGLGMVLLPLLEDDEIEEITVVEYSEEVIDIVGSQLPKSDKLRIVHGDVFTYVPEHEYNTIWLDIWNSINSDVYEEEMIPLMERYKSFLVQDDDQCFLECWASYEAANDLDL